MSLKVFNMKKKIFVLLIAISAVFSSCFNDKDDVIGVASTLDIQNFIWRGLNFFYVYKADTPELANDAFASDDERNIFLNGFDSPESLFDYLKSNQDRFSILVDDFIELENALAGITLNNGMEFGLIFYPDNSGNVFGYVRYVLPNTDAAAKGIQRGMIFNTVDGQQINENNFSDLLSPTTYTIGLATFDGTTITTTGATTELIKSEVSEDPIHIARTLTIEGQNVGYLMYNAFTNEFDSQLNAAFAQFQNDNIIDLVLDLRYNGGGSVRSAVYLSSMITGQFTTQVFFTEQWNEDRQPDYAENGVFLNSFVNGGEAINSLNLNRVFVLTSSRSASASELVINGLAPYIDVIQIGTNTTGKYQASFLLYDAPAPNFSRSQANPDHTYAMLPLVFQTANSAGFTDFIDGLVPDIALPEDYSNLGVLGDETEPLLAAALEEIFPGRTVVNRNVVPLETISESKANSPAYQIMIADQ